jgi:DNA (cytosine-5)-methyltransferase 1
MKTKFRVLDLFSGIGGFSLGLERTGGFETVAFCEIEPYPRAVLKKHWPKVPCYEDVRTLTADALARDGIAVDVICGGFPCQDLSIAGKQAGIDGERSGLWSEIARLAGEIQPRFVLVENVPELLRLGMGKVLGDLAALGFDAEWHSIPASAIGAPICRDRVWLVAWPVQNGFQGWGEHAERLIGEASLVAGEIWGSLPVPRLYRSRNGVPNLVDRLAGVGNAVVPQIPELIGRAILQAEGMIP